MHPAVAGAVIAAITLALLYFGNRRLGVSGGLDDLCGVVLSRQPYFRDGRARGAREWRFPFLLGLVLGGVLSAVLSGGWAPIWDLGMLDAGLGLGRAGKLAWMFTGGLLIGFGTRLANGCTSGHGIFGMANLEAASVASTISFMAAGMLTTNLLYRVLLP
jgi:uncharacterized membrane protein YedE/YeeE